MILTGKCSCQITNDCRKSCRAHLAPDTLKDIPKRNGESRSLKKSAPHANSRGSQQSKWDKAKQAD